MPIISFPRALLSVLSLAILAAGGYLLWRWFDGSYVLSADGVWRHLRGPRWWFYLAGGLLAWSFFGRLVVLLFLRSGTDEPRLERAEGRFIQAPDASSLHVEISGRPDGATLIFTHGWGLNSTAWWYARRALGEKYRLVTWDLPGLGRSKLAPDGKITIDRFAEALGAVVESVGRGPIILVGHSIGGMITQTVWRACPEGVTRRVSGVVLLDTTYRNPLHTMWLGSLWRALRWPLIEPMCWASILLSPIFWLASWQGYLSGSNQLAMRLTGFGRFATRGQVDFTALLACKGSPGVQAKGNMAMFRWDARNVLPRIPVPVLVLSGSRDIVTLPQASTTIANTIPSGQITPIEGCGHMGFMERSEIYNDAIAAFADEVFAGARVSAAPHS